MLKGLYRLSELLALLLGLFVLLVILAQVVGRFLGFVVPSALELAGFATAGLIFLGLGPTFRAGGHIRVELLLRRLPPKARAPLGRAALGLGAAASLYAAFHSGPRPWRASVSGTWPRGSFPYPSGSPWRWWPSG